MDEAGSKKEKTTAFVLFLFSLIYFYGCLRLKVGHLANPGPGFMPFVVGVLLLFFTALNLFRALQRKQSPALEVGEDPSTTGGILLPLGTALCVVAYPFLLKGLKYTLSTFLVMFFMLAMNRFRRPVWNAMIAMGISLASFVFFYMILGVVLPMGKIETFLLQFR